MPKILCCKACSRAFEPYHGRLHHHHLADDRIAEIIIDTRRPTEHVLDAMDLVRAMVQAGVTAAKIIPPNQTKTG
jgi:hypothetical protein